MIAPMIAPMVVLVAALVVALIAGLGAGIALGRRGSASQLERLRNAARRERDDERERDQRTRGEAAACAAKAHEDLVASIRVGHADVIAGLREQLAGADAQWVQAADLKAVAERELAAERANLAAARAQMTELRDQFQADRAAIEDRIRELVQTAAATALSEANNALLEQNTKQFVAQRAETMMSVEVATKPLTDGIQLLQQSVVQLDKAREAGAESLKATLETMARSDDTLRQTVERSTTETAKLATALRDNRVRGRWGEIGLRNILDKVGLTDFCDFVEQGGNEDGKRPDIVIALPGDREVAVDAKVPFEAYLCALEASDPTEQQRLLVENAGALRAKVRDLASKGYHRTPKAIGFTILYVQIESVFSAALSVYPMLVEEALELGVVISSPATLLAYLGLFARDWSLHKQSLNAADIVEQAHEMLKRLVVFAERFAIVGAKLDGSVKAWNDAVGSFDGRLAVTAKQIAALSGTAFAVAKPPQIIDTIVRPVQKIEELGGAPNAIVTREGTALALPLSA